MRLPTQINPNAEWSSATAAEAGVTPSAACVTAKCTPGGQCCATIPVIGQFCIANPLPIGASARCCLEGFLPPQVCCYINDTKIGCFP